MEETCLCLCAFLNFLVILFYKSLNAQNQYIRNY